MKTPRSRTIRKYVKTGRLCFALARVSADFGPGKSGRCAGKGSRRQSVVWTTARNASTVAVSQPIRRWLFRGCPDGNSLTFEINLVSMLFRTKSIVRRQVLIYELFAHRELRRMLYGATVLCVLGQAKRLWRRV